MRTPRLEIALLFAVTALAVACESPAPQPSEPPAQGPSSAAVSAPPAVESAPAPAPSAEPEAPTQITAQHILVIYKGADRAPKTIKRTKAEAQKRAEEALAKAKSGQEFAAVVKEYSDEPGAAERLGNLGRFNRDVMARPFSDAAFALKVGEISGVVETPFGFHVIKRNQ